MESKNTFILHETEAFMRGELDNVTVAHGRIVLDLVSGGHVPYGCYTSPAVPLPTFDALRVSWNAGTPPGTAVEAQARVMVDGNWTSWSSFGRWSPYLEREGAAPVTKGAVNLLPDSLVLDSKTATQAQLRIYLYTKDEHTTPSVSLAPDALCRCAARSGAAARYGPCHLPGQPDQPLGRRYPARRICPCHARLPQY